MSTEELARWSRDLFTVALLAYIGFGVLTLRASSVPMRIVGVAGALISVGYIFVVAMTRSPWPL